MAILELVGSRVATLGQLSIHSLLASTYTDEQTLDEITFQLGAELDAATYESAGEV